MNWWNQFAANQRARTTLAYAASITAHVVTSWIIISAQISIPDLGVEWELPAEVEFGITEGSSFDPNQVTAPSKTETEAKASDANGDKDQADAPATQDQAEDGAKQGDEAAQNEQGAPSPPTEALPPGAQLAVRLDMALIRESSVRAEVESLLREIPDWEILLEGSGIRPLDDLRRLLIASPNMRRENLVIAGLAQTGQVDMNQAVQRIAAANGCSASWKVQHGVQVATWCDADATARVIAKISKHGFVICRPVDLPRVLAAAQGRSRRDKEDLHGTEAPPVSLQDGLLSMPKGQSLTLEIEGARNFMRSTRAAIPDRVSLQVGQASDPTRVDIKAQGFFDKPTSAQQGAGFFRDAASRYAKVAQNYDFFGSGWAQPLRDMKFATQGSTMTMRTQAKAQHIRLALGFIENEVRAWNLRRQNQQLGASTPRSAVPKPKSKTPPSKTAPGPSP